MNNMERRKLFSENKPVERRKLFSTPSTERNIKLFSENAEEEAFQRVFSKTDSEYELKLKEFSGKSLSKDEYLAAGFTDSEVERGFAEICEDGSYKISDSAFLESRMFSKIILSVTKTLELDPAVMNEPKEEAIEKLDETGKFPAKVIMLLRKAHNIPVEGINEKYLKDSGISHDLPIEFGGRRMGRPEFERIMHERYEDAPTDIMEILKEKGIVKVDGDNVEIIK